ncbi:unnamed protein product [Dovyalis caffra]|uniref:Pentatricopeptide repeat-containing protein n=1 Tax=Dovyalis caffra TaxID=77055 RepID=A0AAV1S681_9ROSI|nr:unnamed protein product [Dovyalis caffra]
MMVPELLGSLIHQCSKTKALRQGLPLHAIAIKTATKSDVIVSNHILNMYAKCGKIREARHLFDEMPERNLVSWSAMISGYEQIGEPILALGLFSKLKLVPNEYIYASVISACASLKGLSQGKQIHGRSLMFGFDSVSFVSNALVTMYMKCGQCSDAFLVSNDALELNVVACNALITGFVENRQPEKGFEVFRTMYRKGFLPDRFTFVGLLGTCNSSDDLRRGEHLHCQTIKLKLDSSAFIGNLIITMYSKLNLLEEVEKVFRLVEEKDLFSWNTFISACSHCNDHEKALGAFKEMLTECSVRPDDFTFASALAACSGLASIGNGKQIHGHLIRTRLYQDVGVGNALVNMYAKCGCIGVAFDIFSKMEHQNLVSWNTMIAGFGNHGLGGKAIELFEKMRTRGVKPDSVTFVGLLTACNHAGWVDEGRLYFNSMEETYGISPEIEHFSCLIDLLGRAGRLNEAEKYMKKFPFGHDPVVLGSLLSACRLHGDVDIGKRLGRQLLKLQPVTTSPYVLLSNLCASDEMWDGVAEAWKLLKGSGLKKEPGHSLIEVKGTFEKFTVVDFSHSRIEEIKDMLKTLSWAVVEVQSQLFNSVELDPKDDSDDVACKCIASFLDDEEAVSQRDRCGLCDKKVNALKLSQRQNLNSLQLRKEGRTRGHPGELMLVEMLKVSENDRRTAENVDSVIESFQVNKD